MATYPATLPLPSQSYTLNVDTGVTGVKMNAGNTLTRRRHQGRVRSVTLVFDLTQIELHDWSDWMDANGYQFFNMPLITADQDKTDTVPQPVKLVGPWSEEYLSPNAWRVSVPAELVYKS